MQFRSVSVTELAAAFREMGASKTALSDALSGACAIKLDGELYAIEGSPAAAALPGMQKLPGIPTYLASGKGHSYCIYRVAEPSRAQAAPLIPAPAVARANVVAPKVEPTPPAPRAPEVPRIPSAVPVRVAPAAKRTSLFSIGAEMARQDAQRAAASEADRHTFFVRRTPRPAVQASAPIAKRGASVIAVNAVAAALAAKTLSTTDTNNEPPSAA